MSPVRLTAAVLLTAGLAFGAPQANGPGLVSGRVLVRFASDARGTERDASHVLLGTILKRRFRAIDGLDLVEVRPGETLDATVAAYRNRSDVLYAEPDHPVQALAEPNDPGWPLLWNLHNTGQTGGTPGADVDALDAWGVTRGSRDVVVVVIDTGIDYRHPDLDANVWRNESDCDANGLDDDGDGFADDCHGVDVTNRDGDPDDDHGHGTHVAGTIGATGDNGIGVVGVAPSTSIAACKFLDADGTGYVSGAVACLDWVASLRDHGVRVVATNNSWGGGDYSQALVDAIAAQRDRGILFVAAAGNDAEDIDLVPHYPAAYDVPNIVAVAATAADDDVAWFSNQGRRSVHVGAPGVEVFSTVPGGEYDAKNGTSMAAPHVTGVIALLAAANRAHDWRALRNLILSSGDDVPALAGTMTGKRIDAFRALTCTDATVRRRTSPSASDLTIPIGRPVRLEAVHIRCTEPAGVVTVSDDTGSVIRLVDDGTGADTHANDGIYAATWTPSTSGDHPLTFPDGDVVVVHVSDGADYIVEQVPMAWRVFPGSSLDLYDDETARVLLPFPIRFGGVDRTVMHVGDNGLLSFDGDVSSYWNESLPVANPTTLVAPFWDDMVAIPGTESNVYIGIDGAAPRRELAVEWRNVVPFAGCFDHAVRFQAVFFEDRPDVLFQYDDVASGAPCATADGGSATVGLQIDAMRATAFSVNEPSLHDGMALRWTPLQTPSCRTDAHCDDGIACTSDRCVEGSCEHTPDDGACDDGDACTADRCDASAGCATSPAPCWPTCFLVDDAEARVTLRSKATEVHLAARLRTAEPMDIDRGPVVVRLRSNAGEIRFEQVLTNLRIRRSGPTFEAHGAGVRYFAARRRRDGGQRLIVRVALPAGDAWTATRLEIAGEGSGCIGRSLARGDVQ